MEDASMIAKGVDGLVELFEDKIKINRKGFSSLNRVLPGDNEFMISDITSIEFKKAGAVINGYIQFAFVGAKVEDDSGPEKAQLEDSVMFVARQQLVFEELRVEVERKIAAIMAGSVAFRMKELQVLEGLLSKGMIDQEQFDTRKQQLMSH